jgi:cell division protein FtsQ
MRDYKNVKVPGSFRSGAGHTTVKRVQAGGATVRSKKSSDGITSLLLKIMVLIIVVGGAFLAWYGYRATIQADMFVVSGVDVKGVKHLSEKDVKEIAGLFKGQNIFRADIDSAVRRARSNPWVKEARIYRRLPNRMTMVFTERAPAVILETGAERFLMDDAGTVIERLAKDEASAWPLPVVALRGYRARPGEQVVTEGLAEAMLLIAEISSRGGWRLADVTVKADSPEALSVVYAEHEFKIGSGRYGEKLRRLAEVMADVKGRGLEIAYVDLRPERQTAVMVKNAKGVKSSK